MEMNTGVKTMDVKITKTSLNEADALLKLQKEAFTADIKKYKDYDSSPAGESLEFFKYRINNSYHYTIFINGNLAGSICIVKVSDTHYRLFRIFLGIQYQNKGLGSKILTQMEKKFPQVKTWSLDTPKENRRNRHFYEKFGYKKTGEFKVNDRLTLVEYEKRMK
jgi:ribosomal protein S18 acetylase RimI-like enzyme